MDKFINTHRLDYLRHSEVFIRREFFCLQKIGQLYRHRTAEFLIRNNLCKYLYRHQQVSFLVLRIYFRDLWEWHIRDEIIKITGAIENANFISPATVPDCIWMLKRKSKSGVFVYFCDIVFFWHGTLGEERWRETVKDLDRSCPYISRVEILTQSSDPESEKAILQELCRPSAKWALLQCEFSNDC